MLPFAHGMYHLMLTWCIVAVLLGLCFIFLIYGIPKQPTLLAQVRYTYKLHRAVTVYVRCEIPCPSNLIVTNPANLLIRVQKTLLLKKTLAKDN
jgi:hypothetical protein